MRKMIIMTVAYLSMQLNVSASMNWYGVYNEKGEVEAKFVNNLLSQSNIFGGSNFYSTNEGMFGYSQPNIFDGENFYSNKGGFEGYTQPNIFGGYNFYGN